MRTLALLVMLLIASLTAAKPERQPAVPKTMVKNWSFKWSYRPLTLKDCPPGTVIVINYSVSIHGPYRSYCYWGMEIK